MPLPPKCGSRSASAPRRSQGPRPGIRGRSASRIEEKRQAPPRLFDLPSLQKTCGQRWGWTADKTLSVAQELYDGDGKKLITYPRAEARYLSENQIRDVPAIVAGQKR
jgi:DNA topoisomerase III